MLSSPGGPLGFHACCCRCSSDYGGRSRDIKGTFSGLLLAPLLRVGGGGGGLLFGCPDMLRFSFIIFVRYTSYTKLGSGILVALLCCRQTLA